MPITLIITLIALCLVIAIGMRCNDVDKWSVEKLARSCPDFKLPPDDHKVYIAYAGLTFSTIPKGSPKMESEPILGLRAAYIKARRLGVKVEREEKFRNPRMSAYADGSYPDSVGVYWALREATEDDFQNRENIS